MASLHDRFARSFGKPRPPRDVRRWHPINSAGSGSSVRQPRAPSAITIGMAMPPKCTLQRDVDGSAARHSSRPTGLHPRRRRRKYELPYPREAPFQCGQKLSQRMDSEG